MIIYFQGKNRPLKMTYYSIHVLELAFQEPYANFIMEQTPFNQSLYCFWAMIQNEEEFKGLTVPQIADLLEDSLAQGEFTLDEYFDKVNSSYADSLIVQQLFKQTSTPRKRGEENSPSGRSLFYGIVRRFRDSLDRFLAKHSQRI